MNKNKLSLEQLKVTSFVTNLNNEKALTVKGGDPLAGTGGNTTNYTNNNNQDCNNGNNHSQGCEMVTDMEACGGGDTTDDSTGLPTIADCFISVLCPTGGAPVC